MAILNLKASDKAVQKYTKEIENQIRIWNNTHTDGNPPESRVEPAFLELLQHCAKRVGWNHEWKKPLPNGNVPDGTFTDKITGIRALGYMEAKDDDDILSDEIITKIKDRDYPDFNILFWQPKKVILIQKKHGTRLEENIHNNPAKLVSVLKAFFEFEFANIKKWTEAIKEFEKQIPHLSQGLIQKIERSEKENKGFIQEFEEFYKLCKVSINPNISKIAIKEMVVQHLLTERLLRSIFNLENFTENNLIAQHLEKVITAMTSSYFNRRDFLGSLDDFYLQIIEYARDLKDFHAKQAFLNEVFERFFQGWAVKTADKLGIVYTPQPVVNFMVNSVDEILKTEFGRKHGLGNEGVHIIDPFVGTGNFIVNVISKINATKLDKKYESELHCNEIQLMPYYIACVNIEHAYYEIMKKRKSFEGICFADTFQMYEDEAKKKATEDENEKRLLNKTFFNEENTERVVKQREQDIFVVICNPPYNTQQTNEMDNNKNRTYKHLEKEIKNTYSKDSKATLKNKLMDPYVKAIKWASKRIGDEGVVAMITNNSFLDAYAFDGMRKHLGFDFNKIITLNLGGNIRKCEGGSMNIFGIRVGVAITFFIKNKDSEDDCNIFYYDMKTQTADNKKEWLADHKFSDLDLQQVKPNKNHLWLTEGIAEDFNDHLLMGDKKQKGKEDCDAIFNLFSCGVVTSRDAWVYNFNKNELEKNMKLHINTFNSGVDRWKSKKRKPKRNGDLYPDDFITYDERKIKWTDRLKTKLLKEEKLSYLKSIIRNSTFRPFCRKHLYFDSLLNQRRYQQYYIFPTPKSEKENRIITVNDISYRSNYSCLMLNKIPESHLVDSKDACQNFPFYTYNEDGTGRRENITDRALKLYQTHYENQQPPNPPSKGLKPSKEISKWDIFYYIYAMLHHSNYREDFKENLKRSLPRIPFAKDFWRFAGIGKKLADIHLGYETAEIYDLDEIVDNKEFPNIGYTVEKMKLKKDEGILVYNNAITLSGIPKEVFDYKLGNRSALEWIIDQYRVKTDKRSGITQDPNNFDGDEKYIFELVGKIVTVSLETVKLVSKLSKLPYK